MAKHSRHKLRNLVPHPRYGSEVRQSIHPFDPQMIRYASYRYKNETIFPESAIPADIKRQNYSVIPRAWYFDTLKTCRDCRRNFLFFAEEQKYWYERLGFTIDADCVRCPQCRKSDQTLRRRFNRYSQWISRKDLDAETLALLVADACFLWEQGILKNADNLRRLKNLACRRIPEEKVTGIIVAQVEEVARPSHAAFKTGDSL